jgi:ornithine carbamoyltransferase
VLQQVRSAAGIPIYDGLTAASHPTARLAGLLGVETPIADRRRFVVQAVLLATII